MTEMVGFKIYAWPLLAAGLSILFLGVVMVFRERGSSLSRAFLLLTFCSSGWLLGFFAVNLCGDPETAMIWVKAANTFVVFIPSVFYLFVVVAARQIDRHNIPLFLAFSASEIFLILVWSGNTFISSLIPYFWGFYPRYGNSTLLFLVFFFGAMASSFRLLWVCHRRYGANTKRFKTFLAGFAIAYLASVDFLPAYGIPVYPCGYLAVLVFSGFMAWGIIRRHLADITPSFAAEQILKTMADGLLVLDREGTVRLANESARYLFGEEGEELIGRPVHAGGMEFFKKQNLARLLWTGGVQNHEVVYYSKPQGMHVLDISTSVIRDSHKEPLAVVCIIKDATARKNSEAALRDSEKHYRILAENVTDVIWTMDMNLKLTYVSPSILKLTGFTPSEAVSRDLIETFTGHSSQKAMVAFTGLFHGLGAMPGPIELEYRCKEGTTVWAEVTLSIIRDEKGSPVEILGVSRNIAEHLKVRESVKTAENLYLELASSVSDPVFILDRNCVIRTVNPAAEQILGMSLGELAGKSLAGILSQDTQAKTLQEITCVFLGWQRLCFDAAFSTRDGRRLIMEAHPKLMLRESDHSFVQVVFKNPRQRAVHPQNQNVA